MKRLIYAFRIFPARLARLGQCLAKICPWRGKWWADFFFLLADLLFLFDAYEIISNGLSPRTRPLSEREVQLLRSIYGASLPYSLIRIDEQARIGPPQGNFCYVSFHTINSWGRMREATLIHEAMHVWQYVRVGAAYIPRALAAQRTEMGYNYGGPEKLARYDQLTFYNYEQQADIIADAFCYQRGFPMRWTRPYGADLSGLFAPFLAEIRGGEPQFVD